MKIITISDTHNKHLELDIPLGDVLIHAGDCTLAGTKQETTQFLKWFSKQPHTHKILVGGNHDFYLEKHASSLNEIIPENVHYLHDSGISINNINFWGSPYTPGNGNWAFNKSRGNAISTHWKKIPQNTHYLITHSPPFGIMDELDNKRHIGCERLLKQIKQLQIPNHIFGHVHNDYGIVKTKQTLFANASSLDERYRPLNAPLRIDHVF